VARTAHSSSPGSNDGMAGDATARPRR
jgi:hypothetical protein